ncbi:MAG: tRNA pseudouridine(38-40) synthase TruA [Roseiflexaceae bacterium]|nr:tRNA pseudouridine(38-40) synthase TruA [Roseiflexaceae bacterium]
MKNVAFRIEYDGTDFSGSQWQNNGRSVQGAIEAAWEQLTQERQRVTMSGRTDAGVHARGQVANVRTATELPFATIRRGLNAHLPEDAAVLEVWEADSEFHARHSAIRRDYRYLVDNSLTASPLLRNHVVHVPKPLDVVAMQAALMHLIGRHDFAALTVAAVEGSTVRTCYLAQCEAIEILGRPLLAIDVAANAFLQHMVRNIAGTVLQVGEGRMEPDAIPTILASRDRRKAGRTAPAHGLYLMSVTYPLDSGRLAPRDAREDIPL